MNQVERTVALHIREFPSGLMGEVKARAAINEVSLREYVIAVLQDHIREE